MLILESHSVLGRFKRQNGLNKDQPNAEKVPSYIQRCKISRELAALEKELMDRLRDAAPVKHSKMQRHGFDTLVMSMGDLLFEKFLELRDEVGLLEAYITIQTPGYNHQK